MQENMLRIFGFLMGKITFPIAICIGPVCNMSFYLEPLPCARYVPIFRKGQSDLWRRTGIDAEGLGTTTQMIVFEFHGLLLTAHRQYAFQPSKFSECLLYDHMAGVVARGNDVNTISYSPFPGRVIGYSPLYTSSNIPIVFL